MIITEEMICKAIAKAGGSLSRVTLKVIRDFNVLDAIAFMRKYSCTKETYLRRFILYGDPYMKAPLARIGKVLMKLGL